MTNIEMRYYEEAFSQFLASIKRRKVVKVQFYLKGRISGRQRFAFIGFRTKAQGLHGLQYTTTANTFYFGTFNEESGRRLNTCYASQVMKIPTKIKDAMLKVCLAEKSQTLDLSQF
jgi:hypothetical protein